MSIASASLPPISEQTQPSSGLNTTPRLDQHLDFRVSTDDLRYIDAAARLSRVERSVFCRTALLRSAHLLDGLTGLISELQREHADSRARETRLTEYEQALRTEAVRQAREQEVTDLAHRARCEQLLARTAAYRSIRVLVWGVAGAALLALVVFAIAKALVTAAGGPP